MRRGLRRLGLLMIVAGLGMLAWAGLVYAWQDPFTAIANKRAQRALGQQFEHRVEAYRAPPQAEAPRSPSLPRLAARFRGGLKQGDAVGRLTIPRLGVRAYVVYGTDKASLRRGPGIDARTTLPGTGELVYIAGHRTTYGAPFSDIDKLRPGDSVTLQMPYATFTYRVTNRRIVPATYLQALDSRGREEIALQACWPRFFASHRIIVYAKPIAAVVPRRSTTAEANTRSAGGPEVTTFELASTVGLSVSGEWSLFAGIAIA